MQNTTVCRQCMGMKTLGIFAQKMVSTYEGKRELQWVEIRRVQCPNCNGTGEGGRYDYWNGPALQDDPFNKFSA